MKRQSAGLASGEAGSGLRERHLEGKNEICSPQAQSRGEENEETEPTRRDKDCPVSISILEKH
jgi:hypothetical protein